MVNWKRVFFLTALFTLWYCWPTEGMDKAITLEVNPKVAVTRTTFHIIWRIPRHAENRQWSMAYACSKGDESMSSGQLDEDSPITYDVSRDISIGEGCVFEACVYRKSGKPFQCDRQTVGGKDDK